MQVIWNHSPFVSQLQEAPDESFAARIWWFKLKSSREDMLLFVALAWASWSYRNSMVFGSQWQCPEVSAMGFVKLVLGYKNYTSSVNVSNLSTSSSLIPSRSRWNPPSFGTGDGSIVLGEALAARMGVEVAAQLGYSLIELECDAINVVNAINRRCFGRSP
uniref:Uncharacterized protein n=1 Tax=Chenopodium quinoa TaxID=63459 RepID=A0A803MF05_CHEQI